MVIVIGHFHFRFRFRAVFEYGAEHGRDYKTYVKTPFAIIIVGAGVNRRRAAMRDIGCVPLGSEVVISHLQFVGMIPSGRYLATEGTSLCMS